MAQLITCPECKKQLQVPDNLLGKTVQCPECKHTFTAAGPGADDSNAETAPAEPVASKEPEWEKPGKRSDTSKKKKRRDDDRDDEDDYDDRDDEDDDADIGKPRKKRSRSGGNYDQKPGKVTALGVMALVGGILGILLALGVVASSVGFCCLWPGTYYSLIMGIMAITRGSGLLGANASEQTPPTGIAVMMIINIINGDVVNCVLGIIMLVFCSDDEVKDYLAK